MNSCLYKTQVFHKRFDPKVHEFSYKQFMFCIDLSELEELNLKLNFFSNECSNLYSLQCKDHFPYESNTIEANIKKYLKEKHQIDGVEATLFERKELPVVLNKN